MSVNGKKEGQNFFQDVLPSGELCTEGQMCCTDDRLAAVGGPEIVMLTAEHPTELQIGAGCCCAVLQGLPSCTAELLLSCTAELQRTAHCRAAVLHKGELADGCTVPVPPVFSATTSERRIAGCNTYSSGF